MTFGAIKLFLLVLIGLVIESSIKLGPYFKYFKLKANGELDLARSSNSEQSDSICNF